MAYPGQYGTVSRAGNSADHALNGSYRPLGTNATTNPLQTTPPSRSTINGPQPGILATSSALQTNSANLMTISSPLYAPQAPKSVSLKSGFTMSISDPELISTRAVLPQSLITPVR